MKVEKITIEFNNLEIHMGDFRDTKFKMKADVEYEDNMLVMDGGKIVARLHARNIGNCHLEKKSIRIAALNFEIKKDDDVSVATGSIKLEVESSAWVYLSSSCFTVGFWVAAIICSIKPANVKTKNAIAIKI